MTRITQKTIRNRLAHTAIVVTKADRDYQRLHCGKGAHAGGGISLHLPTTTGGWRCINFKRPKDAAEWLDSHTRY